MTLPAVHADYFDGRSARALRTALALRDGTLVATPAEPGNTELVGPLQWPLTQVRWPERTRHTRRVIDLPGGAQLVAEDSAGFDVWRRAHGLRESWVVKAQQHWRSTLVAVLLLLVALAAGYRWGVPALGDQLVAVVPAEVDRRVGEAVFSRIETQWLSPSRLAPQQQASLRARFGAALAAYRPAAEHRPWRVEFRAAHEALGANALALPDGTIIFTDQMVELLAGHEDSLVGVFGHEYGHLHLRHGMRALLRFALLSTAASVLVGDFSSLLAGAPVLLAQMGYSRHAEREADLEAARMLRAAGIRPQVMIVLFDKLATPTARAERERLDLPIALASHPADDERRRFFREAGR